MLKTAFYIIEHSDRPVAGGWSAAAAASEELLSLDQVDSLEQPSDPQRPVPLVVVREPYFEELLRQVRTIDAGLACLVGLAARLDRPVALHVRDTTTFLSPPGWSEERLEGWAAGRAADVEQRYGEAETLYGPGSLQLDPFPSRP